MKPRKYVDSITFRLSLKQREAVQQLADMEELSIGEAARALLDAGMRTKGIA
jgi:hypothetical protein